MLRRPKCVTFQNSNNSFNHGLKPKSSLFFGVTLIVKLLAQNFITHTTSMELS